MKKIFTVLFLLSSVIWGQVAISVGNPPADITFSSFDGSGFATSPTSGQLDSDEWRVNGLSDGSMNFGDTKTSGDFARGESSGHITTGGIYSFNVGGSNNSLGIQPGGSDMTPGNFTLKLVNTGSEPITELTVSYKIYFYNDQNRSNSFNFAYSVDDASYISISAADFSSPGTADASPSWNSVNRTVNITGLNVAQNEFIYLQWQTDDVNGSGSRDEFALDDITFSNVLPVELTTFSASVVNNNVELSWETATEVNNYGFSVERRQENGEWSEVGFVEGHGNSNSPKHYTFIDNEIGAGKYFYRLKQVDIDGSFEYSDAIEVDMDSPVKYELSQNFPNPFNPTTSIQFSLPETGKVKLAVYNVLGEQVAVLVNKNMEAGFHNARFDASKLNSGIYIYKLEVNNFTQIRKMMLVK